MVGLGEKEMKTLRRLGKEYLREAITQNMVKYLSNCVHPTPQATAAYKSILGDVVGPSTPLPAIAGMIGLESLGGKDQIKSLIKGALTNPNMVSKYPNATVQMTRKNLEDWVRGMSQRFVELFSHFFPGDLSERDKDYLTNMINLIIATQERDTNVLEMPDIKKIREILLTPERPTAESVRLRIMEMKDILGPQQVQTLLTTLKSPRMINMVSTFLDQQVARLVPGLTEGGGGFVGGGGGGVGMGGSSNVYGKRTQLISMLEQLSSTALEKIPLLGQARAIIENNNTPSFAQTKLFFQNILDMCRELKAYLTQAFKQKCVAWKRRQMNAGDMYLKMSEFWDEDTDANCTDINGDVLKLDAILQSVADAMATYLMASPEYQQLKSQLVTPVSGELENYVRDSIQKVETAMRSRRS